MSQGAMKGSGGRAAVCMLALASPCGMAVAGDVPEFARVEEWSPLLSAAEASRPPVRWTMTAELWLTTVDGDFGLNGVPTGVNTSFWDSGGDNDDNDDDSGSIGLHIRAEADINRFILFLDTSWAGAHEEPKALGSQVGEMDFGIWWFEFGGGYRIVDVPGKEGARYPGFTLDALVGGRVTTINVEFDPFFAPNSEGDRTWIEPYVGAQMMWRPIPNLSMRLAGDVGGFGAGSEFSWQASATLGYTFYLNRFALTVYGGYRALAQDFEDDLTKEISGWDGVVHGPTAGVVFEF